MIKKQENKTDRQKLAPLFDPDSYEIHKSSVAIIMGHFFLRYLNLIYHEFKGDFVLPMVLGEIAHHNILRLYSKKGDTIDVQEHLMTHLEWMRDLEPTNAFSISNATGIPRETVRRKIQKLEKKGWIVKNKRGEVFISETVGEYFTKDFNKQLLSELLETTKCIRKLLETD